MALPVGDLPADDVDSRRADPEAGGEGRRAAARDDELIDYITTLLDQVTRKV